MTDAATNFTLLRRKFDVTADDVDWRANQTTPNELTAVVGGTTTAGVYSITFTGEVYTKRGGVLKVAFTASFTRAAENDATIAGELEDDMDAGTINPQSPVLLSSVGITADVSSATITMRFPPNCKITATSSAPGSATIVWGLGTTMPITASAPLFKRAGNSGVTGTVVYLIAKDDLGATLLTPQSGTISGQLVEIVEVETVNSDNSRTYSYSYGGLAVLTGLTFNTPIELPTRGMKWWTFRLLTDASLPTGTDAIDVVYRDYAG